MANALLEFGRIVGRWTGVPLVVQEHSVDEKVSLYQAFVDWTLRRQSKQFTIDQRYTTTDDADLAVLRRQLNIPPVAKAIGILLGSPR